MNKYKIVALILVMVAISGVVLVQANTSSRYLENGYLSLFYHAVRLEETFPRINPVGMAIEEFDKAAREDDDSGEAELMMGLIYHYLGRPGTALGYFLEFSALHPEEAWVHALIGDLYVEMGRFDKAEESFERAIEFAPEGEVFAKAHFGLGNIALERGDYPQAREAFANALENSGDFFDARLGLGMSLYYLAEYDEAISTLELAQLQAPRSISVFQFLGLSYQAAGLDDQAQHAFARVEELKKDN